MKRDAIKQKNPVFLQYLNLDKGKRPEQRSTYHRNTPMAIAFYAKEEWTIPEEFF